MIKRPKPNETEEDILCMQKDFYEQKAKNPKLQPAVNIIEVPKETRNSLFAKNRALKQDLNEKAEHHGKAKKQKEHIPNLVLGDIVEKRFEAPKENNTIHALSAGAFPKVTKAFVQNAPVENSGKSIFALSLNTELQANKESLTKQSTNDSCDSTSAIVEDIEMATEIHKTNLETLSEVPESEILAQREKLLKSMDPSLVALLSKRRQLKGCAMKPDRQSQQIEKKQQIPSDEPSSVKINNEDVETSPILLPSLTSINELLQRSGNEKWLHFDKIEKDKMEWMKEISVEAKKLKPGEKFEARFDWKGVLLPYSLNDLTTVAGGVKKESTADDRELFLHGEDPHRPGYTLQELFRLARSNVMQQRISAFGAIGGILNIYNQGFYDQVLELPVSKIFFLLRFGLDDNAPAMVEVVSKALAYLFYNETDETLLDFIHDNPDSYWQPVLQALQTDTDCDDPTSLESLQNQLRQLQINSAATPVAAPITASVEENEESKTSMNDFELAETDLAKCLLRSNILQRLYFIFQTVRPDNGAVSSYLKLLIRIGRTSREMALKIIDDDKLLDCMFKNFLPDLNQTDLTTTKSVFYNFPQYLLLKVIRILMAHGSDITVKFLKLGIVDKLQNYLYNREDLKPNLIKVQIESLRLVRCLLIQQVELNVHGKFLPAFRYMLEWHFNHTIYEVGGPFLIRQHAAALLAAVSSVPRAADAHMLVGSVLMDCCCKWFHKATQNGIKEFSQATMLTACLNAVTQLTNFTDGTIPKVFIHKYLPDFVASAGFKHFLDRLPTSSIVLQNFPDRRNVHAPLPNAGSVVIHQNGPHLVITQTYPVYLLTALWSLMEQQLIANDFTLLNCLQKPTTFMTLKEYLRAFATKSRSMATNFFAATEINFLHKLVTCDQLVGHLDKSEVLRIAYNLVCCLTPNNALKIEELFDRVIFNSIYINYDDVTLKEWKSAYMDLVHHHHVSALNNGKNLSLPFDMAPVLPIDWPYFFLKIILENFLENISQPPTPRLTEREILEMTFNLVWQFEKNHLNLDIVTPTEKLMYLMIAFMGQESLFLEPEMHTFLHKQILHFYAQCKDHKFQFDCVYEGKCKFENLYALFVDHFQAASYADELFASLVLLPLAQKYDNKWRRRVWSDYASALSFLNCDESLLLGGLEAYLEPYEQDISLLKAYDNALKTNLVRPNTIPYKIAKHHTDKFKANLKH